MEQEHETVKVNGYPYRVLGRYGPEETGNEWLTAFMRRNGIARIVRIALAGTKQTGTLYELEDGTHAVPAVFNAKTHTDPDVKKGEAL